MSQTFLDYHLFQILKKFDQQHLPLDVFLSHYFKDHKALGAKDRKFIAETLFGMMRWKLLLDALCQSSSPSWEEKYYVYQKLNPTQVLKESSLPLHVKVSFPEELFTLLVSHYGEEKAVQLCQISNTAAPITIRVNALKTTREDVLKRWEEKYALIACLHSPYGIQFNKRIPFFELQEFKDGLFEVQDEGSQLIASLVQAKPGNRVLDYCSGSGGKTLGFAPSMENKGQIYLHDIRPYVLQEAKKRLKRAGIQNAQVIQSDSPYLDKLKKKMDWVLADVPCSGTGTLRRNPDMKEKFSLEMVKRLVGEQRMIFEKALSFVAKQGFIVYATCSILREENENQVDHFLHTYPIELVKDPLLTLPTLNGMDGFFGAVFKKN